MYDVVYKGRFVWNRLKATANQKKHPGMTFEKGSEAYDDLLAIEEYDIVTDGGRVFRSAHKDLLENLPPDMVKELARRRLADIGRIKSGRGGEKTEN